MSPDEVKELRPGDLVFTKLVTTGALVVGTVEDNEGRLLVRWDEGNGLGVYGWNGDPALRLLARDRRSQREAGQEPAPEAERRRT